MCRACIWPCILHWVGRLIPSPGAPSAAISLDKGLTVQTVHHHSQSILGGEKGSRLNLQKRAPSKMDCGC